MTQNNVRSNYLSSTEQLVQHSVEVSSPTVQKQMDPELVRALVDNGSLIALILALAWFFKILTRFVEVCQKD